MVIGICGGSGSGKTTLLNRMAEYYSRFSPTVFSMDNYYKPYNEQVKDENRIINFDLPTALNREKLYNDLIQLINGESIDILEYSFNVEHEKKRLITLKPSELLIVEGLFVFEYKEVFEKLDFSVFVDVDLKIQLDRRIYRDQDLRGYSQKQIIYQWKNHVLPCYNTYLLPHKEKADFIYHNDSRSETDFKRLVQLLDEILMQN